LCGGIILAITAALSSGEYIFILVVSSPLDVFS
jgi:hypothetical protein